MRRTGQVEGRKGGKDIQNIKRLTEEMIYNKYMTLAISSIDCKLHKIMNYSVCHYIINIDYISYHIVCNICRQKENK